MISIVLPRYDLAHNDFTRFSPQLSLRSVFIHANIHLRSPDIELALRLERE